MIRKILNFSPQVLLARPAAWLQNPQSAGMNAVAMRRATALQNVMLPSVLTLSSVNMLPVPMSLSAFYPNQPSLGRSEAPSLSQTATTGGSLRTILAGIPLLASLIVLPGCAQEKAQNPGLEPSPTMTTVAQATVTLPGADLIPSLRSVPGEDRGRDWARIATRAREMADTNPIIQGRSYAQNTVELADLYFRAPDYLVHDRGVKTGERSEQWIERYFKLLGLNHVDYEARNTKQLIQRGFMLLSLRTYQRMMTESFENSMHTDPLIVKAYLSAARIYFRLGMPDRGLAYLRHGLNYVESLSQEQIDFRLSHGMSFQQSTGYVIMAALLEGTYYLSQADTLHNAQKADDLFRNALERLKDAPDVHQELEVLLGLIEIQGALHSMSPEAYQHAKPYLDQVLRVHSKYLNIETVEDIIPLLDKPAFVADERKGTFAPFTTRIALDKGVSEDKILRGMLNLAEYWTWTGHRKEAHKIYDRLMAYPVYRQMGYLYARILWGRARLFISLSTDQPLSPNRTVRIASAETLLNTATEILNTEAPSGWLSVQVLYAKGRNFELKGGKSDLRKALKIYRQVARNINPANGFQQELRIAVSRVDAALARARAWEKKKGAR